MTVSNFFVFLGGLISQLLVIERDEKRFQSLKQQLSTHGVRRMQLRMQDFSSVPLEDMAGAQVVVVDPSCSNSGRKIIQPTGILQSMWKQKF